MKQIKISDVTMKQICEDFKLSFKEKIELSKLLDKLSVDVIELEGITNARIDSLRIKSIASAVENSCIAVPVELNGENIDYTWCALKEAKHPRLQVVAPTSSVQIEYLYHKKPEAMLAAIGAAVSKCAALCPDVEFIANDATRSDGEFLSAAVKAAIDAGAKTVTLCDTAGIMLPFEVQNFVEAQYKSVPELKNVTLGICCRNAISMADASAIAAVSAGAGQISAAAYPFDNASIANLARIFAAKSDALSAYCNIRTTELTRIIDQIMRICKPGKKTSIANSEDNDGELLFTAADDESTLSLAVTKLGYDLSDEDNTRVYNAFMEIVKRKEKVTAKELDAIVATYAMQVPPTYKLDKYVITSGNEISATAHIKLNKNGSVIEGVYMGDGSIDAAFQTIEKITGLHYELDDFELRAVTEGREAMGETVVKLRSGSKVYSGRGISTDIVGAGIQAYLNALNKIIYEEEVE